jgi:branched-subunit amino acid aminotransferase/4-amino-4-deoxychorismate lyase
MSERPTTPAASLLRWRGDSLEPVDTCESGEVEIVAADSWLVVDGAVLGLELHRQRFLEALPPQWAERGQRFWAAAVAAIPAEGEWFPRVDLRGEGERLELQLRVRPAPERTASVVVATHRGPDPRRQPSIKGPDLGAMLRLRTEAQGVGAGEAILTSPEGYVIEGAYSALAWWRGDVLCFPAHELERIDSVTARSLETLAAALGVEILHEHATAAELDGCEVWALSALQGIRIVTGWIDGPATAEQPGRLRLWRRRLESLRRPV